ncbi:MAG: Do family serine endopeptidase [bacterium]|nr:Do family serine endopeptidase [bacterium]
MKRNVTIFLIILSVFILGIISAKIVDKVEAQSASGEIKTITLDYEKSGYPNFRELSKKVIPSVVHISSESVVKVSPFFPFDDPFFREFFKDFPQLENKNRSLGTGFLISSDGYIVTNYHVIKGAQKISIKLPDGREFKDKDIEIVGKDERTDIALLKLKKVKNMPFLNFGDSDNIEVGDWVMAAGNPFGFDGTITVGVISAKNRSNINLSEGPVYQDFIQTDASINPGNSGGPLVDIYGNVIGVNTAIASPSGGNVGIGFAIPSNMVVIVINQLKDKGLVSRGYLGIYPQDLTSELKKKFGMKEDETGILVSQVEDNSPASKAGLKDGDIILEFDGKKVENVSKFRILVAQTKVGKEVKILILRDGKKISIDAKIGELKENVAQKNEDEKIESKWLGIVVDDISNEYKKQFNINVDKGVVITSIENDSPVIDAGLRIGDVIVKIENMKITSLKDYKNAEKKFGKNEDLLLTVKRGNINIWVVVKIK